jgi:hypothetical protein
MAADAAHIGHNLLIFLTIRRASLPMWAILAFGHFAISKIPAASAFVAMIDRTAEDTVEEELIHGQSSPKMYANACTHPIKNCDGSGWAISLARLS